MAGCLWLASICIMVPIAASWQTVDQYKAALGLGNAATSVGTSHDLDEVREECLEALLRLASEWEHNSTRMYGLERPSYAFRLQDAPPKPRLASLRDVVGSIDSWYALLTRIMNGDWIDPAWKSLVQPPWSMEHLCYRFRLVINGNMAPNGDDLCIPFNKHFLPPARGPYHQRHYLSNHPDGYIMVNLGTTGDCEPVQMPLHTILAFAFHGAPSVVPDTGRMQEVAHLCNHPWCINPRHLVWCSHQENCGG